MVSFNTNYRTSHTLFFNYICTGFLIVPSPLCNTREWCEVFSGAFSEVCVAHSLIPCRDVEITQQLVKCQQWGHPVHVALNLILSSNKRYPHKSHSYPPETRLFVLSISCSFLSIKLPFLSIVHHLCTLINDASQDICYHYYLWLFNSSCRLYCWVPQDQFT